MLAQVVHRASEHGGGGREKETEQGQSAIAPDMATDSVAKTPNSIHRELLICTASVLCCRNDRPSSAVIETSIGTWSDKGPFNSKLARRDPPGFTAVPVSLKIFARAAAHGCASARPFGEYSV